MQGSWSWVAARGPQAMPSSVSAYVKLDVWQKDVGPYGRSWMATRRHPRQASTAQEKFARRLRELRQAKGMSQMDMVRDHGWSLSHFQKLERGVVNPRLTTILALAEALGVEPGELLNFTDT